MPASVVAVATVIVPVAAEPPGGSAIGNPQTSWAKLLAKKLRNIEASSLP